MFTMISYSVVVWPVSVKFRCVPTPTGLYLGKQSMLFDFCIAIFALIRSRKPANIFNNLVGIILVSFGFNTGLKCNELKTGP